MAYSPSENEQCYSIPNQEQKELYAKYLDYAKTYPNLHFCGRLGTYQYLDMDDAIREVFNLFKRIFAYTPTIS